MLPYVLPKKNIDQVIVLNTPVVGDAVLAVGTVTLLDEAGSVALKLKMTDVIGYKKDAYTAGTAHVVDVDVTGAILVANGTYSLTVSAPNVVVKESGAVFQTRTYTVSVDATPTVAELQALFVAAVNADAYATATASSQAGDVVRLTADSVFYGQLQVSTNVVGVTVADQTAYVAPVGSYSEVASFSLPSDAVVLAGGNYDRYTIKYNKFVNNNAVSGLKVVKEAVVYLYLDSLNGGTAATEVVIDAHFAGTSTAAKYLGAVAL